MRAYDARRPISRHMPGSTLSACSAAVGCDVRVVSPRKGEWTNTLAHLPE